MNMGENRCGVFPTLLSMFGGCSEEGQLDDLLGLHRQVESKSGNWVESPACVQLVVEVTVLSPFFIGIRSLCLMLFFWSEVVHPSWRLHDGMRWPLSVQWGPKHGQRSGSTSPARGQTCVGRASLSLCHVTQQFVVSNCLLLDHFGASDSQISRTFFVLVLARIECFVRPSVKQGHA
jgi:hypothetical protein